MTGVTSVSTGTYRETSIVPTSCTKHTQRGGAVQGTQGAWGHRGHILYTKLKHTCFTSYRKKTEAWRRQREKGGREEGFGLIFKYKRTCKNRIASRHCAPIFTVIETGSGAAPWQHHPFQIRRYKDALWRDRASAMTSDIKTSVVWEAEASLGEEGEVGGSVGGWGGLADTCALKPGD